MSKRRGFTLVEVLVVVMIVGILATLGTVAYRRYVNSVRTAEAAHNITGIATAQQGRKQETGTYLNVSGKLDNLYPAVVPGMFKTAWGGPCDACLGSWASLTFRPDAPVAYGYATVASQSAVPQELASTAGGAGGPGGGAGGPGGGANQFGKGPGGADSTSIPDPNAPGEFLPDATGPYFTIVAKGDADGNGIYASALYYSETNAIVFDLAGE